MMSHITKRSNVTSDKACKKTQFFCSIMTHQKFSSRSPLKNNSVSLSFFFLSLCFIFYVIFLILSKLWKLISWASTKKCTLFNDGNIFRSTSFEWAKNWPPFLILTSKVCSHSIFHPIVVAEVSDCSYLIFKANKNIHVLLSCSLKYISNMLL